MCPSDTNSLPKENDEIEDFSAFESDIPDSEYETCSLFEDHDDESDSDCNVSNDTIAKMNEKFHKKDASCAQKLQILTLMTAKWKIARIVREMKTSRCLVKKARKLAIEQGVLRLPEQSPGRPLPEKVKTKVQEFYELDAISSVVPGMTPKQSKSKEKN